MNPLFQNLILATLLLVLVVLGSYVFFGEYGIFRGIELQQQKQTYLEQIRDISNENAMLRHRLRLMDQHPIGIRREAATSLGVGLEGDILFQFQDDTLGGESTTW